jgi:hypothetical protein
MFRTLAILTTPRHHHAAIGANFDSEAHPSTHFDVESSVFIDHQFHCEIFEVVAVSAIPRQRGNLLLSQQYCARLSNILAESFAVPY